MNPTTSQDALAQLQQTESQAQNPNDILANQRQQLGVDSAQNTVTGLRGAINNTTQLLKQVAPSVMGRTANSLVTNAQATKQISNEQAPISANLTQEGTDYNNANSDLQQLESKAETAANGIYQGQQDKLSYAQNLYNSLLQKEQDAAAQAFQQQQLQEQIREANMKSSTDSSSGLGSVISSLLGGGSPSKGSLSGGKTSDDAYNAVKSLLGSNNYNTILNTYNAIQKSAGYGNTYDQTKLQLLQSIAPGIFKNGQLNTGYLQRTLGSGIKLF